MTSPFQLYREIHDAMNADATVQQARAAHREAEAKLAELRAQHEAEESAFVSELIESARAAAQWEAPYRARMDDAQATISAAVVSIGQSVTEFGVEAKLSAGRRSTEWKNVALRMNASQALIDEYTTPGRASVTVRVI
jgi:hypothetical protein